MTDARPLVIGATDLQRKFLRDAFGDGHTLVVTQGQALVGYCASSILITPEVDRTSEWFQMMVRMRLRPGVKVYMLAEFPDAFGDAGA
jgi:hypothetical protein